MMATLFACNLSRIEDFEQGQNFVDSNSGVVLIDTMKIVASTVRLDSIVTSKLSRLLVGGYSGVYTGTVTANPHFQINSSSFSLTETDLVYDSLVLCMNYDGYFIGDTTKLMTLNVKQITEDLILNTDGYLYNNSSFQLDDKTLAEVKFYPCPRSTDELYLHLSDTIGLDLFNKILADNDTILNSSYFLEYFKGMALVSQEGQNQAAVGFVHDSVSVKLYYHELVKSVDSKEKTYLKFPVTTSDVWFNQILHNTAGTLLGPIITKKNELQSSLTSDQTMIQGGTAVYTKIGIPGIDYLKGYGKNVAFIAANMQFTPVKGTYSDLNPLPDSLSVYIVDHKNMISSQFSNTAGNIYATKVVPANIDQLPYYTIDVSQFFDTELADLTSSDHSLMIGTVASGVGQSINPVVLIATDAKKDNVKLNVFCYIDKGK
jgi:hypothetical protein